MAGEFSTLEIGGFWDGHTPKTPPFVVPIRDRSYVQEFCVQHSLNLKMSGTERMKSHSILVVATLVVVGIFTAVLDSPEASNKIIELAHSLHKELFILTVTLTILQMIDKKIK